MIYISVSQPACHSFSYVANIWEHLLYEFVFTTNIILTRSMLAYGSLKLA